MNFLDSIYPSYEEMLELFFGVVRKGCLNKVYDGWHCTKIRRSVEWIQAMTPASCGMILQTLDALNNVCSAAFERQLGGELEETFQTSYYRALCNEMRVSVTPKAHILSTHVLEYVRKTNKSLFRTSESALESQHRYFMDYYKNYKVLATQTDMFGRKLLNCVIHYNSFHQ